MAKYNLRVVRKREGSCGCVAKTTKRVGGGRPNRAAAKKSFTISLKKSKHKRYR